MKFRQFAIVLLIFAPMVCSPCDAIGSGGAPVSVTSESAVIVWDAKAHVEHFTRSAVFATAAKDVGFLVPTPTLPTLVEANRKVFDEMTRVVEYHRSRRRHFETAADTKDDSPVLQVKLVSGYEATILSLAHPKSVDIWLEKHGYRKSEATTKWLAPYEQQGWVITAFRIAAKNGAAGLAPVQMTFRADVPFYPYSEPPSPSNSPSARSLRIFLLGQSGFNGKMVGRAWAGAKELSEKLSIEEIVRSKSLMPDLALERFQCLTSFVDDSSPRIGTADVTFSLAPIGPTRPKPPAWSSIASESEPPNPSTMILVMFVVATLSTLFWLRKRKG